MPAAVKVKSEGRLAQALIKRMNELDLTIRQLAAQSGMSYEHVRKLIKGITYPSRLALQELCCVLDLDPKQMNYLLTADRIEKKYGGIPHALKGAHPELSLLVPWWDLLSDEQKSSFRIQMKSVAEANQRVLPQRKPARGTRAAASPARAAHR